MAIYLFQQVMSPDIAFCASLNDDSASSRRPDNGAGRFDQSRTPGNQNAVKQHNQVTNSGNQKNERMEKRLGEIGLFAVRRSLFVDFFATNDERRTANKNFYD